eukprot:CAMPEP_0173064192 /NCGR_PEP_ID=MMETSP1102-20130122/4855_1 /TAXON_ID=49646 /ORGANISM="Geminigera sp., Strain Caron Lab Isolate" /LENGTH=648 /DNA_ID=CAMNT_0013931183 /DNA_START=324 /DNA_END=2267 /DNA_ORIENTATION=+
MLPTLDEEAEGAYAHRRAKALSSDMKTLAQEEAKKEARSGLYQHTSLGAGAVDTQIQARPSFVALSPATTSGDDGPKTADVEAAALADLVLQQHTQLKRLVAKAQTRAAQRAAATAAQAKSGKWEPNKVRFRGKSLGFLAVDNPIRWCAIYVCTHGLDELALILIFINTVMLTFYDPQDLAEYNPNGVRRLVLELGDQITSVLFAVEVVVRIVAQGLVYGPTAFLADGWGWLDFVIAATGMLQDFLPKGTMPNMSIIRVAKVLKPLRVITHIPQLRLIVVFVLRVVPVLNMVLLLVAFIFFVFGVIGVQLFQGTFRQGCYNMHNGLMLHNGKVCSVDPLQGSSQCPLTFQCLPIAKVLQGALSWWVVVYFVLLVLLGPMFTMKLFLAIIANKLKSMQVSNKVHMQTEAAKTFHETRLRQVLLMWEEGAACSKVMESDGWLRFRGRQLRPYFREWNNSRESQRQHHRLHSASIGIAVVKEVGQPAATILSLRPGGAALKDGEMKVGDLITHVDHESVMPLETRDVYRLLNGKRGSRVIITIDKSDRPKNALFERTLSGKSERTKKQSQHVEGDPSFERTTSADRKHRRKHSLADDHVITVALVRENLPNLDYEERLQKETLVQQRENEEFHDRAKLVLEPYTGKIEEPV